MKRPLPPELVVLGDQLESAARRALGRRRTRRQLVLNALAGVAIALPVVAGLPTSQLSPPEPQPVVAPPSPAASRYTDELPPRELRRLERSRAADPANRLPATYRRALR